MNRKQIHALADKCGIKTYEPGVVDYQPHIQALEVFANSAIASYKAELLKEVGEPVLTLFQHEDTGRETTIQPHAANDFAKMNKRWFNCGDLYSARQVAAAVLKAMGPLDKPIDPSLAAEIERTDWTPAEALQFYADQRNFDIVGSHARIIDNGAVASNALKHLSIDRLELKGDAELAELRAQLAAAQEENLALKKYIEHNLLNENVFLAIGKSPTTGKIEIGVFQK